jgi:hypothetical protein
MTDNRKFDAHLWMTALVTLALASAIPLTASAQDAPAGAQDQASGTLAPPPPPSPSNGTLFELTRLSPTQVLSYQEPRDLRICNRTYVIWPSAADDLSTGHPLSEQPSGNHPLTPVDLTVSYNDTTTRLAPRYCVQMTSAEVRIRPVQPLAADLSIDGTIEWMGTYAATGSVAETHASLVALREDLAQQDRQMQEATAELNRARDDLNDATRKLQEPQHQASSDDATTPR